jgi:hypothetical protein
MFLARAHAGTDKASRLVTNVDVTPSKPGDQTESGLSGNVYGAIAAVNCGFKYFEYSPIVFSLSHRFNYNVTLSELLAC